MEKNWKEFVKEKYEEYKKIGYVECPAFGGERVYFNKYGFDHLVRKGRRLRMPEEQTKRFSLVHEASKILDTSKSFLTAIERSDKQPIAYFWSFVIFKDTRKITVIVRQLGSSRKHFFSVFDDQYLS